jgi:hypothetical protein
MSALRVSVPVHGTAGGWTAEVAEK